MRVNLVGASSPGPVLLLPVLALVLLAPAAAAPGGSYSGDYSVTYPKPMKPKHFERSLVIVIPELGPPLNFVSCSLDADRDGEDRKVKGTLEVIAQKPNGETFPIGSLKVTSRQVDVTSQRISSRDCPGGSARPDRSRSP